MFYYQLQGMDSTAKNSGTRVDSKILNLARDLIKSGIVYTRADLAYELKSYGVEGDSLEVAAMVYEAYLKYKDASLVKAFVTNDYGAALVEMSRVAYGLDTNPEKAIEAVWEHLIQSNSSIAAVAKALGNAGGKVAAVADDVMTLVSGGKGAADVRAAAKAAFGKYTELVDVYETSREDVKASMGDFIYIREKVMGMFNDYSAMLLDIFGDSIKVVDPKLFDFSHVEWLDVKKMLAEVSLQYDSIASSCSVLINEIKDSFRDSLNKSVSIYKGSGNSLYGVALAGLNILDHYTDSGMKTARLKQDFVRFTDSIKRDKATIKGDLARLQVIFRTLNELYIPKAEAFFKYAAQVFNDEFEHLLDSLYSTPELREARKARAEAYGKYQKVKKEILDIQLNIDAYTADIEAKKKLLDTNMASYVEAVGKRPSPPSAAVNILTFGSADKNYYRDVTEWHDAYAGAVEYYEDLQTDWVADRLEVKKLSELKGKREKELAWFNAIAEKASARLRSVLAATDEAKAQMARHMKDIITLMKIAKDIISSGLDEKYMKTVNPAAYQELQLEPEVETSIQEFTDSLKAGSSRFAKEVSGSLRTPSADGDTVDTEGVALTEAMNNSIAKTVNLFGEYERLVNMRRLGALAEKEYERYLADLQKDFNASMDSITNRGAVLRESLRQMNLSTSLPELKAGLMSLAGDSITELTDEEFDQFLAGNRNIEI